MLGEVMTGHTPLVKVFDLKFPQTNSSRSWSNAWPGRPAGMSWRSAARSSAMAPITVQSARPLPCRGQALAGGAAEKPPGERDHRGARRRRGRHRIARGDESRRLGPRGRCRARHPAADSAPLAVGQQECGGGAYPRDRPGRIADVSGRWSSWPERPRIRRCWCSDPTANGYCYPWPLLPLAVLCRHLSVAVPGSRRLRRLL
jgi:hypothetical protein